MLKVALVLLAAALPHLAQPLDDGSPRTYFYWQGEGDGATSVSIKGRTVEVRAPAGRFRYRLVTPMPDSEQNVRVEGIDGCSQSPVEQQPSEVNDFRAVVTLKSCARKRSFALSWSRYPNSYFDAPRGWWDTEDVVHWSGGGRGHMVLECSGHRCRLESADGTTETFDFDLALPEGESRVGVAGLQSALGHAYVADQPSAENGRIARVVIELPIEELFSISLRWTPIRQD